MPRLTRLRVGALADLAQQLRFAPRKRIIVQLESATALAGEIDPDAAYPEDWVVFRITGFRPEIQSPAMIVGEALRGDLSALVERVSDRAALTESDLPGFLRVDELASRWSVSRKTLERARRRGLIAQRYRDRDGAVRLAFTLSAIEDYERRHGDSIRDAGAFGRIDTETSEHLGRLGARAIRRFGWSVNEAAKALARRSGRGHETMRQLLLRTPATQDQPPGALGPKDRRTIDRAARRAIPIAVIARRYDRTPAAIRLIVNQRRLGRLKRWRLPTEPVTEPDPRTARLDGPPPRGPGGSLAPACVGDFIEFAGALDKPDAARERALATAHRALLARAGRLTASISRSSPRVTEIERAEADLRLAAILRTRLVGLELGLVLDTIESRLDAPLASLPPAQAVLAHDASLEALIRAVAAFDPKRGGRLAASAGLAINKALAAVERGIRNRPDPVGDAGETLQTPLSDWTRRVAPWCGWLDLPPSFERRVVDTPGPGNQALRLLHGLTGRAPLTPVEIAQDLGLSRIAVVRSLSQGKRALRESVRDGVSTSDAARTSVR